MQSNPVEKSFVDWQPVLQPEEVFQASVGFSYLSSDEGGQIYWIENRPDEGGRAVLVMKNSKGEISDVTPKPFSVRSRVFEYGSFPYIVSKGVAFFVNLQDQRIYKMNLAPGSTPEPLTPEKTKDGGLGKYAELNLSPDGRWLVFAYEKDLANHETINEVACIDLHGPAIQEARTLASGASFYKFPKFSPDGKSLAWLEWNHPYMQWDSTFLFEAKFASGKLQDKKHIAGSESSSIWALCYLQNGELIFAADFANKPESSFENYYNLYASKSGKTRVLTKELMEFQQIRCDGEKIYALAIKEGRDRLVEVNALDAKIRDIKFDAVSISMPTPVDKKVYVIGSMPKGPSEILEIDERGNSNAVKKSSQQKIDERNVSEARQISFATQDGHKAYGFFYPPVNANYVAPQGERPPVRVLIHGGPTSMARPGFTKPLQFWTSQGYAVFDVNHRGSVGFGRAYRDALNKKWGLIEIQDVKDGLKYLREQNLISDKAVVSGGSAGGYTVQRLLTFYPDLFAAGASYYGIGNLVTLQMLTHKFESHYLEQLIGGTLETNRAEYDERSPINHLEKLKSPMIIFQGSADKVVPPENSREVAEILKKKGVPYEYYEYPGEEHGFRKKDSLVDSLAKESQFFKKILRTR